MQVVVVVRGERKKEENFRQGLVLTQTLNTFKVNVTIF